MAVVAGLTRVRAGAQLVARHAVFTTTAMQMQNPGDDDDGRRRDWTEVNRLVEEINRLVRLHPRSPA